MRPRDMGTCTSGVGVLGREEGDEQDEAQEEEHMGCKSS